MAGTGKFYGCVGFVVFPFCDNVVELSDLLVTKLKLTHRTWPGLCERSPGTIQIAISKYTFPKQIDSQGLYGS